MASRVMIVRERVLAAKRENPELPPEAISDLTDVPVRIVRRILGVPRPPSKPRPAFQPGRDPFTWKRADRASAALAKILHEKHPLRASA